MNQIGNCDITIIDDNNQLLLLIRINPDNIQPLPNLPFIEIDPDQINVNDIVQQIKNQYANIDVDDDRYDNAILRYGGILEFSGQFDQDMVQKFDQNKVANVAVFYPEYEERIDIKHLRKLQLLMECTTNNCWPIRYLRKYGRYLDKLTTYDCACLCHLITRCYFTKQQLIALEGVGILTQNNIRRMYGQQQLVSQDDIQILRNLTELYSDCDENVFHVAKRIFEHIFDHKLSDEIPLRENVRDPYVYSALIGAKGLLEEISISIHRNRNNILTELFEGMCMFANMLEERNANANINANANQFINLATEAFRHHFYYNTAEYEISHFLFRNPHSSKLVFVGYYTRMLRGFMRLDANVQITHALFGGLIPQLQNVDRRQNFIFRYIVPYQCYNNVSSIQQLIQQHDSGTIQNILINLANGTISLPEWNRDQCSQWIECQKVAENTFIKSNKQINKTQFQTWSFDIEVLIILCRLKIVICDILNYINPQ